MQQEVGRGHLAMRCFTLIVYHMIFHIQCAHSSSAIINKILPTKPEYLLKGDADSWLILKRRGIANCATFFNSLFIKYIVSGRCSSG